MGKKNKKAKYRIAIDDGPKVEPRTRIRKRSRRVPHPPPPLPRDKAPLALGYHRRRDGNVVASGGERSDDVCSFKSPILVGVIIKFVHGEDIHGIRFQFERRDERVHPFFSPLYIFRSQVTLWPSIKIFSIRLTNFYSSYSTKARRWKFTSQSVGMKFSRSGFIIKQSIQRYGRSRFRWNILRLVIDVFYKSESSVAY